MHWGIRCVGGDGCVRSVLLPQDVDSVGGMVYYGGIGNSGIQIQRR